MISLTKSCDLEEVWRMCSISNGDRRVLSAGCGISPGGRVVPELGFIKTRVEKPPLLVHSYPPTLFLLPQISQI